MPEEVGIIALQPEIIIPQPKETPRLLDPAVEYQKAVDEITAESPIDPFTFFKEQEKKQQPPEDITPEKAREFSGIDEARHKLLALEARRQGIKDIEGFKRLVDYFETNLKDSKPVERKYKKGAEAEADKIRAEWKKKNITETYLSEDGKLKGSEVTKFNINRDHVPTIKALLETGIDSMPLFEALKQNAELDPDFFNSGINLRSKIGNEAEIFIRLLKTPNIEKMIPLISDMSSLPHNKWTLQSFRDHAGKGSQIDALIALAETGNIPDYSPGFFEKTGIVAKALGRKVALEELPKYQELINNPDKIRFLSCIDTRNLPDTNRTEGFSLFNSLDSLEKDGLLKPLADLIDLGIQVDVKFFGGYRDYSTPLKTQEAVNQDILKFIENPAVQSILADPDKQIFAKILKKMGAGNISADRVEELFPIHQDLVAVNNLIFSSLDTKYEPKSYGSSGKIGELVGLLRTEERKGIILSPEFTEFITTLKNKGINLTPEDFFKSDNDIFDGSEAGNKGYGRDEYILIQLFKFREVVDLIDSDISRRIIENYRKGSETSPNDDIRKLKEFRPFIDNIKLLRQYGITLDPENFKDTSWIRNVDQMPLLSSFQILDEIPEEKKSIWIQAALNLPDRVQAGLKTSFLDKKYQYRIGSEDIERVVKLASIISSSDFFPKDYRTGGDWNMEGLLTAIGEYKGDPETILTDGKPNAEFAKLLIKLQLPNSLSLILSKGMLGSFEETSRSTLDAWIELPTQLQTLSFSEIGFPNLPTDTIDRYKVAADIMRFANLNSIDPDIINRIRNTEDYQDLFIDGKPSKLFIDNLIKLKKFDVLPRFLKEDILTYYDDTERSVLTTWLGLPYDIQKEVIEEAPNFPDVPPEKAEKYRVAAEVITRIRNSPSAEIKKLEKELIGQLWKLDNPQQTLEEIISIFEKNNLPLVGKVYRIFETIYDNPNTKGGSILENDLSSKPNLSPVLKAATPRQRREIIYRDLLSINIRSGNPQLRDYLEVIRDGENVVAKIEKDGSETLTEREKQQLDHFFNKMDMLYVSSLFGRTIETRRREKQIDASPTTSGLTPEDRLQALKRNFRVRTGQKLSDRLSEMFLRPTGLTSIEDVLTEMERAKMEADKRNRESTQIPDSKIALKAGDRFKAVNSSDFQKILERGAVAREYLGPSAGSDATPYDSDTSLILEEDLKNGVSSAIANSLSGPGYGDLLIVIKNRDQFGNASNQYESFTSGGERHFGIRTGFASTEIDAIIARGISDYKKLDDLFIKIAQNGVYIPVGTTDGTIIFTPEQYNEYRKTFAGVSEYSAYPIAVKIIGTNENSYSFPDSARIVAATRNSIDQLKTAITTDREKVESLSGQIRKTVSDALTAGGVTLRGEFDSSIYGAELVDTGSTSRGSNVPGDYDFDMSLQLDPNDSKRLSEIAEVVKNALKLQEDKSHTEEGYVQIRAVRSQVITGKTLDIDIGVGKRSDEGIFASSDAVAQKLDSIRINLGEDAYFDVLANIVLAKQILKDGHAYKKLEDGGMGGIGVENWILLHNGNILDAFQSFWAAAHSEERVLPYEEFAKQYKIFDAGLNIKFNNHDNFTQVLKPTGYSAMLGVIGSYLGYA